MMNTALVLEVWSKKNLARWTPAALEDVAIPPSAKDFLCNVGLPFREDWTLQFPAKPKTPERLSKHPHLRQLGTDDPVPICVDERGGGQVVAVEDDVGGKIRYVNSSVEAFGVFLALYQQYRIAVRGMDDDEAEALIAQTEKKMRRADPHAFSGKNNYWPVIIEQMHHGLL